MKRKECIKRPFISNEVEEIRKYLIDMYNRSIALNLSYATYLGFDYVYNQQKDYLTIIHMNVELNNNRLEVPYGFDAIEIENIVEFDMHLCCEWQNLKVIDFGSICYICTFCFNRFPMLEEIIADYIINFDKYDFVACEKLHKLSISNCEYIASEAFSKSDITSVKIYNTVYENYHAKFMIDLIKSKSD